MTVMLNLINPIEFDSSQCTIKPRKQEPSFQEVSLLMEDPNYKIGVGGSKFGS